MLSWIIQITIISTTLIFLVHYLINFFTSTLTVPKIKDLVNVPTLKYENMYNVIKRHDNNSSQSSSTSQTNKEYTLIDLLPTKDEATMKTQLKNFLKKQHNSSDDIGTNVSTLDSMSNINSYSSY